MRKSGIELMRIILFFMVVSIHVCGPYFYKHTIVGTLNWQFANFFNGFSRFAVNAFVITSGYFMLRDKNPTRQIKKLLISIIPFVLPYIYLVSGDYGTVGKILWHWIDDLFRNNLYFYHMWYVQVMVIIYLLAGILNKVSENADRKEHLRLILCLLIISSVIPTICFLTGYDFVNYRQFTSRVGLFVTLYIIGNYIRKYNSEEHRIIKPAKALCLFLISNLSVVFFSIVYNYKTSPLILLNWLNGKNYEYPFNGVRGTFYEFSNIFVIISAVLFFLIFVNLNFSSKIINYIAKKTFGAYVLHVFWIQLLARNSKVLNPFTKYETTTYPVYALLFIILVGIFSILSVIFIDLGIMLIKRTSLHIFFKKRKPNK